VLSGGQLLELSFTTLAEYMWTLRATCVAVRDSTDADDRRALFFLAAAVSDFYVASSDLPAHKLQSSEGAPALPLRVVPKMLLRLVREWAPRRAFVVTFKLETDEAVLLGKARKAIKNYG
jgi:phosphopantothenate-cysteine ligase